MTDLATPYLFRSAHEALRFAFKCDYELIGRSLMSRMADGPSRTGKGLGGLDGTAQAGMIGAVIGELPVLHRALLEGRHCPKSFECSCGAECCLGFRLNPRYRSAINVVMDAAGSAVPASRPHHALREAIVRRYFGEHMRMVEIAEKCRVHTNTASKHANAIMTILKTQEREAYRGASDALTAAGLVGEET